MSFLKKLDYKDLSKSSFDAIVWIWQNFSISERIKIANYKQIIKSLIKKYFKKWNFKVFKSEAWCCDNADNFRWEVNYSYTDEQEIKLLSYVRYVLQAKDTVSTKKLKKSFSKIFITYIGEYKPNKKIKISADAPDVILEINHFLTYIETFFTKTYPDNMPEFFKNDILHVIRARIFSEWVPKDKILVDLLLKFDKFREDFDKKPSLNEKELINDITNGRLQPEDIKNIVSDEIIGQRKEIVGEITNLFSNLSEYQTTKISVPIEDKLKEFEQFYLKKEEKARQSMIYNFNILLGKLHQSSLKQDQILYNQELSHQNHKEIQREIHKIHQKISVEEIEPKTQSYLDFESFQKELDNVDFMRSDIFSACEEMGNIIRNLHEKDQEKARGLFLSTLFEHYKTGSCKFPHYADREDDFLTIFSQFHQSTKCIEINGIGGIGKTAFCDIILLLYSFLGKDIIYIGSLEGYASGTGYNYGNPKFKKYRWGDISINKIIETIDDIDQTNMYQNLYKAKSEQKLNFIFTRLNRGTGTILFMDNYISEEIRNLINFGNASLSNGNILYTSKKELILSPFYHSLENIKEEENRFELIDIFNSSDSPINIEMKKKIADFTEGHPIATFLLVSNLKYLNLDELGSFKKSIDDLSNESAVQEYIKRVITNIVNEELYEILVELAQIEEKIEANIIHQAISTTSNYSYTIKEAKKICDDLIRCDFLEKDTENQNLLVWKYNQIREAIVEESPEQQLLAINYYEIKIEKYQKFEDKIFLQYHLVKKGEIEGKTQKFIEFYERYENKLKFSQIFFQFGEKIILKLPEKEISTVSSYLGKANYKSSNLEKALEYHEKAYEIHEKLGNLGGMANQLGNMGLIYMDTGKPEKALENHQKAYDMDEKLGNLGGMADDLGNMGLIYRDTGKPEKALEYHQKAYEIHEKLGNLGGMASDLGNMGNVFMATGKPEKALEYHQKAYEIHENLGNLGGMANQLGNMGLNYMDTGKPEKALENYQKAYEIHEKLGNLGGMADDLGNMGLIYRDTGKPEKALEYHQKAYDMDEKLGNLGGMADDLGNMGNVFKVTGKPEKALENHQKAYEIHEKLGNLGRMADDLGNTGLIYRDTGKPEKALEYHQKAYEIHVKLGDLGGMASDLGNMGLIYMDTGKPEKALEYLEKAYEIFERLGNLGGMASDLGIMGLIYMDTGKPEKALEYLEKAYEIFERLNNPNKKIIQDAMKKITNSEK